MASTKQWNSAIVKTVRDHAMRHYNEGGWDYVIETFSDDQILEHCHGLATLDACISAVGRFVRILDERRKEIQNA